MSLAGQGIVAIWHDIVPEGRQEFYEWHNREHMPERMGIPGFRRGRRYIAVTGSSPMFFCFYEGDSLDVVAGPDYLQRLNNPSEWTRRMITSTTVTWVGRPIPEDRPSDQELFGEVYNSQIFL